MGFFGRIFGESGGSVSSKQTIKVEGPLELHDGRPALSAEMRAQLERSGVDPADVEAALAGGTGTRTVKTSFTGSISVTGPSGKTVEGSLEMKGGHPALSARALILH
jgi:3-oxoacyl-(acyl-carrier-protein) synthase